MTIFVRCAKTFHDDFHDIYETFRVVHENHGHEVGGDPDRLSVESIIFQTVKYEIDERDVVSLGLGIKTSTSAFKSAISST